MASLKKDEGKETAKFHFENHLKQPELKTKDGKVIKKPDVKKTEPKKIEKTESLKKPKRESAKMKALKIVEFEKAT